MWKTQNGLLGKYLLIFEILKFIDIDLYLASSSMYSFWEEMCLAYLTSFFITIILFMITLNDKVNICVCLWRKVRYRGVTVWNVILKSKTNSNCSEYVFSKYLKIIFSPGYILIVMCYAIPSIALWPGQKCFNKYFNLHITEIIHVNPV